MFSPRGYATNLSDVHVDLPESYNFLEAYPHCDFGPLTQECGCCYAYGALKAMSHRFCRATEKQLLLSAQYIVACDIADNGCVGGCERSVFYFMEQHGLTDYKCHPFQNRQEYGIKFCSQCSTSEKFKLYKSVYGSTTRYVGVEAIKKAVYLYGPVSASIATDSGFVNYHGGIYESSYKGYIEAGNHAVELIGWGKENGVEYWILLNQHGKNWGINGTMHIKMGSNEGLIESFIYGATPLIE
ncbi:Clan CA, family C1, cathepsin B-like cysteine peptidase [Trichomonas vaginalis G3]|uniref:Clan CA, family C1, cathepsin B-like cysteine peptidase n=1 Tax=Trichomonas vaginalis (strain ATCC PRA-98 / G3) TaxID=412133 RepID=A2ENW9_TRIV3|nr:cysteine-type peptidase protein [Trichomonas vaginalis G3]EAY05659.1 Clan CA, family C1, cathepsin B-like cysteine peptidase [Trichomonas vaginalis G3]KAI5553899.1 cysteine-type peptidase protein [Trichomonas vaginalis G3]|eukprot:XP_001317882.1 Clan CA, family C1, cathepsin B-like cysteine peptidase [Trichomonas vaginalis G3]